MKQFSAFVKKEFYHILRDRRTLLILLGMPVVQILIFGFALSNEVGNAQFVVLDPSHDIATGQIIARLDASRYFEYAGSCRSYAEIEERFRKGGVKLALVFPSSFNQELQLHTAQLQLVADASDPNTATTLVNYASAVIRDYQSRITAGMPLPYSILPVTRMLYNPQLKPAYNFVPGVIAMVLMLVCTMMTAITIVKEKETGTMEVMLVSPVRPLKIVLAKAIPYLLLSFFNVITILLLSVYVLGVPVRGSVALLLLESGLFIVASLSIGLLISTATGSQQTAMFLSLLGMFLPTVLLSGFMFPIENMPWLLQQVSHIVPAKWFYQIVQAIMIKGSGLTGVLKETGILLGMTALFLLLSIRNFKNQTRMRTLRFILQKEFKQIFRDPAILRIILVMPFSQLLVLPWAADYETKNIHLAVIDQDHSQFTRQLVEKITASGYFKLAGYMPSYRVATEEVAGNRADIILQIPAHFERDLVGQQQAPVFLAVNSINGSKAMLGSAYLQSILADFSDQVRQQRMPASRTRGQAGIEVLTANWYNPLLNYRVFMVPGILVVLVTMIGCFLAAMNIVREKEIGTIEQINVTPIRKHHFIIGKLIPFWVIGLVVLTIGLFISWALYGIVPAGSYGTIYIFSGVYLLAVLGLGLLVSTVCATQQQAMLVSFFLLMTFILLGGLFTPIESMPGWAQWLTRINPVSYFIDVIRRIILKGSSLGDIMPQLLIILGFAVVLNGWAVLNYRKTA